MVSGRIQENKKNNDEVINLARRPIKNKGRLKGDAKNLFKLQFRPREIIIPSRKNEQKTAELIYDVGASVRSALRNRRKNGR